MKKTIAILLTFLLLLSQFGVHAKSHYCMDRFIHLEFSDGAIDSKEVSCVCGMIYSKASGCCQDVAVHASVNVDGIHIQNLKLPRQYACMLSYSVLFVLRFEPMQVKQAYAQTFFNPEYSPQWLSNWTVTLLLI